MGRHDGISKFVLIIHAYNQSDIFLERSREIRSRAPCFSCSNWHSVCWIVWKRWSRNKTSTKAACSLLVRRMAVAMSSHRWRAFIQNSKLIYQWGMCSEEAEWQEEDVAEVRGIWLTVVYWMKHSLRYWVVQLSTSCIKVSKKVLLLELEHVGQSNSVRISLIVSRSSNTSVSDTRFSSKVGSTGCVDLLVLWNVLQDAICFIVGVIFYKVTANHRHQRMLLQVPTRPWRLDILPIQSDTDKIVLFFGVSRLSPHYGLLLYQVCPELV
jgi:hypothetical protein